MRSNLGRLRRTSSRSLIEQLATLTSVGDGSTLSLDFTTGVLDPRLTFTRTSNATFINSSGLVQYADANMVVNADLVGAGTGNIPTAWTGSAGINLSIPATGVRRAETTTTAQNWIQSSNFTTNTGLTYSTSVQITAVSGQHYANTLSITSSPTLVGYYLNGSSVGQYDTAQPGLLTVVWTATGTHGVRIGIGSTGANVPNAVCEFTKPRTVPGNFTQPTFFANSSTTAAYHAPRFDYDPTTLAPRGLLIEGIATSLSRSSQNLTDAAYWTLQTAYASTSATGGTAPDGTNTGNLFTEPSSNLQRSIYQSYGSAAGTYTFSVWLKAGSGSTRYMRLVVSSGVSDFGYVTVNMSTGAIQQAATVVGTATNASATVSGNYTATGWRRYSLTVTLASSVNFVFLVPIDLASIDTPTTNYGRVSYLGDGSSFLVWGAQLETGSSGASSYIPTGASQGSRAADTTSMTGTNFSSWYSSATECSMFVECAVVSTANYGRIVLASSSTNTANTVSNFNIGVAAANSNRPFLNGYVVSSNNIDAYVPVSGAAINYQPFKVAARIKNGLHYVTCGTGKSATSSYAGFPASLSALYLAGSDGSYHQQLWIKTIKFWPTGLTNTTLDGLAT